MSKKSFTLIILLILTIFGLLGWYLYTRTQTTDTTDPTNQTNTDLFPFGAGGGNGGQSNGGGDTSTTTVIDLNGEEGRVRLPRLRQISFVPTAGAVASSTASSTMIRYIERATGHIYQTDSEELPVEKISAITIPKVYEGLFTADSSRLLIRYFKEGTDTIRTFYAKIATTTRPEQAIEGLFLADDIRTISVYGKKVFYLVWKDTNQQGIVADIDGGNKTAIFNSSFGEWAAQWTTPNLIALSSKPSQTAQGHAYLLNATTGDYTKTVGSIEGLETLPNSTGELVLFSGANGNGIGTSVFNTKTNVVQQLSVSTLAPKCVWSKKVKTVLYCGIPQSVVASAYPDAWYKGKISFNDSLWKIDAVSGETEQILVPELTAGISMDMTNLSLDQKESIVLFTNKKDMTVWRFNTEE